MTFPKTLIFQWSLNIKHPCFLLLFFRSRFFPTLINIGLSFVASSAPNHQTGSDLRIVLISLFFLLRSVYGSFSLCASNSYSIMDQKNIHQSDFRLFLLQCVWNERGGHWQQDRASHGEFHIIFKYSKKKSKTIKNDMHSNRKTPIVSHVFEISICFQRIWLA